MADDNTSELSVELSVSKSYNTRGIFDSHYDKITIKQLDEMEEENTLQLREANGEIIIPPTNTTDKPQKSCIAKECHDIITSPKWWANWFAAILAILAAVISIYYTDSGNTDFFMFIKWTNNPNGTLTINNGTESNTFCIFILFISIFICIIIYEIVTNYHDPKKTLSCNKLWYKIGHHFIGYFIFWLITIFSFFMDAQRDLNSSGLGYSIISIIFGMVMTNIFLFGMGVENADINPWAKATKISTKSCEFYIKVGLVLLATDLDLIISLGAPGLLVSWLIPPLIIIFMWYFGVRVLKITNFDFVITIASGAAICGTSAIAAVGPTVGLGEEDTAIAMAILTFFTMLYMVAVPYICILGGIDMEVCGAWIGGSVDETGKVVASLSILDNERAADTGVLIKVSQNILIAFVCLALAVLYDDMVNHEENRIERKKKDNLLRGTQGGAAAGYGGTGWDDSNVADLSKSKSEGMDKKKKRVTAPKGGKCAFLWKKFPKFIIGYLALAVIISVVIIPIDRQYADRFMNNISQISKWMFTLGFVGIGAKTKLTTLWESIKDGKYLKLYLCGQTIDTIITFIVAFLVFTYIV